MEVNQRAFKRSFRRTLGFVKGLLFCYKPKVFCISFQRTGTTSVGQFLRDHGYRVASYGSHSKEWSDLWEKGDYEAIFKSLQFRSYQAYEDNPWWFPDFYRVLQCRFPNAKFILLYRDEETWFRSMKSHAVIKTLTNSYRHSKIYNKLDLFYDKIDNDPSFTPNKYDSNNHIPFVEEKERYIRVYREYYREAVDYFNKYAPEKLFTARLEDKDKWARLGRFLELPVDSDYSVHQNKTL